MGYVKMCDVHGIKARAYAHAEIAHFPTQCIMRTWKVLGMQPHVSQALMMHLGGKCAISAWAWIFAIILNVCRQVPACDISIPPHPLPGWLASIALHGIWPLLGCAILKPWISPYTSLGFAVLWPSPKLRLWNEFSSWLAYVVLTSIFSKPHQLYRLTFKFCCKRSLQCGIWSCAIMKTRTRTSV